MEKTREGIIVEIFRRFTSANRRNFMEILGVTVNVEYNMRTSMENEQVVKVFANRQEFEE